MGYLRKDATISNWFYIQNNFFVEINQNDNYVLDKSQYPKINEMMNAHFAPCMGQNGPHEAQVPDLVIFNY